MWFKIPIFPKENDKAGSNMKTTNVQIIPHVNQNWHSQNIHEIINLLWRCFAFEYYNCKARRQLNSVGKGTSVPAPISAPRSQRMPTYKCLSRYQRTRILVQHISGHTNEHTLVLQDSLIIIMSVGFLHKLKPMHYWLRWSIGVWNVRKNGQK